MHTPPYLNFLLASSWYISQQTHGRASVKNVARDRLPSGVKGKKKNCQAERADRGLGESTPSLLRSPIFLVALNHTWEPVHRLIKRRVQLADKLGFPLLSFSLHKLIQRSKFSLTISDETFSFKPYQIVACL